MLTQCRVAVIGSQEDSANQFSLVLEALGIDMGSPFLPNSGVSQELASSLRRWWSNSKQATTEPAGLRIARLKDWVEIRSSKQHVGVYHPLLARALPDLIRAWGTKTKLILIDSFVQKEAAAEVAPHSLDSPECKVDCAGELASLELNMSALLRNPDDSLRELCDFLTLSPNDEQLLRAKLLIQEARGGQPFKLGEDIIVVQPNPVHSIETSKKELVVATVLCGNSAPIIADAIKSVMHHVDQMIVIDTGCSDGSIKTILSIAPDKVTVRPFRWSDDFSAARNYALECARQFGASWSITVDTDERLNFGNVKSRDQLHGFLSSKPFVDVWFAYSSDGLYCKERVIRLSAPLVWKGRVHEEIASAAGFSRELLTGITFAELHKSAQQLQAKFKRDLSVLRQEVSTQSTRSINWYYLGQTLQAISQYEGAVAAYDRYTEIRECDEIAAWSCFRAAKCLADSRRFDEAIARCGLGLSIHPHFPELAWMIAWCYLQLEIYDRAIVWSRVSITLGAAQNSEVLRRQFFRDLIGWYDGPWEVLIVALERTSRSSEIESAKHSLNASRIMRKKYVASL